MPESNPSAEVQTPPVTDLRAAVLSYLVPGLGQMVQGRVGKGLLFLVSLYALFFYGMYLGSWSNVYLPGARDANRNNPYGLPGPLAALYNRFQFGGQFWIGIAAWPAIWQYQYNDQYNSDLTPPEKRPFQAAPEERTLNTLQAYGDKTWDLGWVYTVIAGVLNILVIYDAYAGPTFHGESRREPTVQEAAIA